MQLRYFFTVLFIFVILFGMPLNASFAGPASVRITEIAASNSGEILDEDGDNSDWIEIYNGGAEPVNLEGWSLTDDSADPSKWTFPSRTLEGGAYLVVFASGKDRKNPNAPLHTNFKLESEGEYLALIAADGRTTVTEFAPSYPPYHAGHSFGLPSKNSTPIAPGDDARILIPTDDSLGNAWIDPAFDDSSWQSAATGVGFAAPVMGFDVLTIFSKTRLGSIDTVFNVLGNTNLNEDSIQEKAATVNFNHGGEGGHYSGDGPFPGIPAEEEIENVIVMPYGNVHVPQAGEWTFGVRADNEFVIFIGQNGMLGGNTRRVTDFFWTVNLNAGANMVQVIYYKYRGSAELELFAAPGRHSSFDESVFRLVGDAVNGGLSMSAGASLVQTNVQEEMKGVNSSLYVRISFAIEGADSERVLKLSVTYNDGFVAYLNGREVARINAPTQTQWNSAASSKLPSTQAAAKVEIPIPNAAEYLVEGENLLAIQAMNASTGDDGFVILPVLESSVFEDGRYYYLNEPSPGSANSGGVLDFVAAPMCSPIRGFYGEPFEAVLTAEGEGIRIRYTTDGSVPTESNGLDYEGPIAITTTTTLRAASFQDGMGDSAPVTHSYIFLNDVIHQTAPEGYPDRWGGGARADYDMDPDVVNDSRYKDTIVDDLKSIPTLSIVTAKEELFDSSRGIYVNTEYKGDEWERPTSAELIFPYGEKENFQIDCGIQIQGGYSRIADRLKHSFRLLFKRQYGKTKLEYPLFDNSPVTQFDTLAIRGNYNDSWHHYEGRNVGERNFLRDEYSRRSQLAAGQPASHGIFVHLYLNGLYWGLYNICERPDDNYAASYFGGDQEDYDVVTSGTRGYYQTQVKGGNKDAWEAMMALANGGGFGDDARYHEIQQYLDVDNLIDYMLLIFYTGNRDAPTIVGGGGVPWNFYSNRKREPGAGFRFYAWDSEWTLEDPKINIVTLHDGYDNPAFVFNKLLDNQEFKIRLADRIHKHFFNGGAFTPQAASERFVQLADSVERAVVGESARWGDKLLARPKTLDDNWLPERERLLTQFFPKRTETVVKQMRNVRRNPLYPSLDAPEFNRHGGTFPAGFELVVSVTADVDEAPAIYYTTDGSDPRLPGGALNVESALEYNGPIPLTQSVYVRARALDGETWSAITEAAFVAEEARDRIALLQENLKINEIMYHPTGDGFEYIELYNSGAERALDLSGLTFTNGIDYVFPEGTVLPIDEYLILGNFGDDNEKNAFAAFYQLEDETVLGPYDGRLANEGERLSLQVPVISSLADERADWRIVEELRYDRVAPWTPDADGTGMSLQRVSSQEAADDPSNWAASTPTPGRANRVETRVRRWMDY